MAVSDSCRLLLVEDDEDDYLITQDLLASQDRMRFALDWCSAYEEGLAEIRRHRHDAYLIDYQLNGRTGLDLVREGFGSESGAPVILLTGHDDYRIDLEASALGVADYLTKQALDATVLERVIRYAVTHSQALSDLARTEERYALAARAANDGIWDWDLLSDLIYLSPRWHAILGLEEVVGETEPDRWFERVHEGDLPHLTAAIEGHLAGCTRHLEIECRMRHAAGDWLWVLCRGLAIRNASGTPTRMAGSIADVTQRHLAEERLRHDALHDPLTGLPNRALLLDRIAQILQRSRRSDADGCAVIFLDVDRFKLINDSFSHNIGDQLLIAISTRLSELQRPGDTVARLGGDEFTLVLDAVTSGEAARAKAREISQALERPFEIAGHEVTIGVSVGICLSKPEMSPDELLRDADIAMYDAKRHGGGTQTLFDETMHERVLTRLTHERELRRALEESLLSVHYQPIIDLRSGQIKSFEALARWPEAWPPLPPSEFIPIAEESGLIGMLGRRVLSVALAQLASWRNAGLVPKDTCISVNISRLQLDDPTLPDQILAILDQSTIAPGNLVLEITESTLMHEPERVSRIVSDVCEKGVGLHLDDFGTGYSSLSALLQFPVRALKIDRSFVNPSSGDNETNEAIVRSTVALAHSLGLEVVAEGVETSSQLERLVELSCDCGQGYLFARPLSAAQVESFLRDWRPLAQFSGGPPTP